MKGYTDCEEKRWLTDGMTKARTIPTWYVQIEPWILLSHPELTGIKNPVRGIPGHILSKAFFHLLVVLHSVCTFNCVHTVGIFFISVVDIHYTFIAHALVSI